LKKIFGDNIHLFRWARQIASYTKEEREAFKPPAKKGLVAKSSIVLATKCQLSF
jgi:hypothetical protein